MLMVIFFSITCPIFPTRARKFLKVFHFLNQIGLMQLKYLFNVLFFSFYVDEKIDTISSSEAMHIDSSKC